MLMLAGTESVNPLIPTGWEVMVIIAGAIVAALFVGALISIARDRNQTAASKLLWLLIVLALPVLGPIVWLLIGRTTSPTGRSVPS